MPSTGMEVYYVQIVEVSPVFIELPLYAQHCIGYSEAGTKVIGTEGEDASQSSSSS